MDRIAQIKQFLEGSPDDSFLKHALALEYIKLNDDITARQLFEELLAHEPGYVGSYYHLGKLLERAGDPAGAISVYEKGMAMAKAGNERHAYNELQSAFEDLTY
ncbi:tetratricopeptide repeat protein [Chitinophaga niastensis]|uniref:Tetratricopeptide repeat protein n=1 Tax=Chitinophaga niastensis TaxID=536980 RepID=A0A2P8HBH1_CHINA|nr:tetratricopeptide repeat protein [Chitinophaga niastensis]PSL43491.1 tetratricopeptide repeat protein [Chitinophaga niastensis]